MSVFPMNMELPLSDSVTQPIEAHAHGLGHILFDGVVDDASRVFVVELEWCGSLRVSEFCEGFVEWDEVFCGEEACASLSFLSEGHDGVDQLADDVDGVITRRWCAVGVEWRL